MKDYCVILSSYQNTPEKVEFVNQTLSYFQEMGVDVCLTTHSAFCIDELSKKTKWTIYDSINEFMEPSDWVNNIDVIDDPDSIWGKTTLWKTYSFFNIITNFASDFSPHLRSCFSLFANAVRVVYDHGYKWFVYLEYDVAPPKNGYCDWFEKKIEILESTNSNTFYYKHYEDTGLWPVGFFFISQPEIFIKHPNFQNTSWKISKREWVKQFQRAFFETSIKGILETSPVPLVLQTEYLTEQAEELWGTKNYSSLDVNKFNYNSVHTRKDGSLYCCIVPSIQNGKELFIFWENNSDQDIRIDYIKILDDNNNPILDTGSFVQSPRLWTINPISMENISDQKLHLFVKYEFDNVSYEYEETFDNNYFDKIYDYLKRIIFY